MRGDYGPSPGPRALPRGKGTQSQQYLSHDFARA